MLYEHTNLEAVNHSGLHHLKKTEYSVCYKYTSMLSKPSLLDDYNAVPLLPTSRGDKSIELMLFWCSVICEYKILLLYLQVALF